MLRASGPTQRGLSWTATSLKPSLYARLRTSGGLAKAKSWTGADTTVLIIQGSTAGVEVNDCVRYFMVTAAKLLGLPEVKPDDITALTTTIGSNGLQVDGKGTLEESYNQVKNALRTIPAERHILLYSINDDSVIGGWRAITESQRESNTIVAGLGGSVAALREPRTNPRWVAEGSVFATHWGEYLMAMAAAILGSVTPRPVQQSSTVCWGSCSWSTGGPRQRPGRAHSKRRTRPCTASSGTADVFDLILGGGTIVDGTATPARAADVGIEGERITSIGDLSSATGERLDCGGLVVSPGFIDMHSHTDFSILEVPDADSKVRQGITTEVVGNCGFSTFPIVDERRALFGAFAAFLNPHMRLNWSSGSEFFERVESNGSAVNLAPLVGHGSVRLAVMGMDPRPPTAQEIEDMKGHVRRGLDDGAWGYSTGLIYAPCSYAQTEEVAAVAEAARPFDGIYFTHMRDEGDHLLDAIEEALTIGRSAGLRVQISHFKSAGARNWGRAKAALEKVEAARAAGQDVMLDQYPYLAGSTTLTALLPPTALEGGIQALLENLRDADFRARARKGIAEGVPGWWNPVGGSGWDSVAIAGAAATPEYEGQTLADIGAQLGGDGFDAVCELLLTNEGAVSIVIFMMSEDDLQTGMRHPLVMVGSDGFATSPEAGIGGGRPHPRTYGCFPRVLGTYVRELGVLSLETAVHKMSAMQARRLGLTDRGEVREGAIADLVVFDPDTVAERSTYTDPHQYPAGIPHVLVAGRLVVHDGQPTGARPGKVLRHPSGL